MDPKICTEVIPVPSQRDSLRGVMVNCAVGANRDVARNTQSVIHGQRRHFHACSNRERFAKGLCTGNRRLIWPCKICVANDRIHSGRWYASSPVGGGSPFGAGRSSPGSSLGMRGHLNQKQREKREAGQSLHRFGRFSWTTDCDKPSIERAEPKRQSAARQTKHTPAQERGVGSGDRRILRARRELRSGTDICRFL